MVSWIEGKQKTLQESWDLWIKTVNEIYRIPNIHVSEEK